MRAEASRLDDESSDLERMRDSLQEQINDAEHERKKITGGNDASAAESERLAALGEMLYAFEQYARAKAAGKLLQMAINKSREGKDRALARTDDLLRQLTAGAFEGVREDYDEGDKPVLAGVRQGGEYVRVEGMSDGTRDQMYLALFVAALEERLEKHASGLPFIADDLFVNFDNERAAAGFKILGKLAEKTQVLFFSHHAHLLEIARKTLGDGLSVHILRPQ